ncbi:TKL protein kinase [Phytophthora megakarya]|uniref:TKL protein kinase n=1 Tax=Phytophthora megakarya TaxID=4795 RepID=A0A225V821_9STRA|nr:TKL protein kinase [Phytophthora megakarya]
MQLLESYEQEPRLLIKLADTGRVVKLLNEAVKTSFDLMDGETENFNTLTMWRQVLLQERESRIDMYEAFVGVNAKGLFSEVQTHSEQVEVLTLLKHNLEVYSHILTPREKHIASVVYNMVTKFGSVIVKQIPSWFTAPNDEWHDTEKTWFRKGEEAKCIRQMEILRRVRHPNLRRCFGACHVGEPFIVHEKSRPLSEKVEKDDLSWEVLLGCAQVLEHVHTQRLVYQNLGVEHFFESQEDGRGLLSGVGLHEVGTSTSPATDVLAFGLAVFALLECSRDPDKNGRRVSLHQRLPADKPEFLQYDEWKLLIRMCGSSSERWTMGEVVCAIEELVRGVKHETVEIKCVPSPANHTITEVLEDIREHFEQNTELADFVQAEYDRLREIYHHLVARDSISTKLAGDFLKLMWDFSNLLKRKSIGLVTETLGISIQRLRIRRDINRFVLWYPELISTLSPNGRAEPGCEAHREVDSSLDCLLEWLIPSDQIELESFPVEGSFGTVYRAKWLDTKVLARQLPAHANDEVQFLKELSMWSKLSHPNVERLFGVCDHSLPFVISERLSENSLTQSIDANSGMVWQNLLDVALGLNYLHSQNIIHGDLKCNNIVVDGSAKICDFGLTSIPNYDVATSIRWKAPELLRGEQPSFASDIYSLGMCIIEAITGEVPWTSSISDEEVKYNVTGLMRIPERPNMFRDEEWKLIERCCCFDPERRMSSTAIVHYIRHITRNWTSGIKNKILKNTISQ